MKKTFKKRAFISAIAMLIVSAIVLTSATYAWFSMATKVTVDSMELNVTSPEGIQVSANTSAFTTKLTADEITGKASTRFSAYEGHMNNIPENIVPSSTTLATPDRLPSFFTGSIDTKNNMTVKSVADVGSGFVAFDLFVKVKSATTINFGKTEIKCDANPELKTAMRVALVNCGTVAEKDDATEIQKCVPGTNAVKRIYEIDASNHTQEATAKGASGIMTTRPLNNNVSGLPTDDTFNNIVTNAAYIGTISAPVATSADQATLAISAGITRVRVYMWMEGNDVDCANDVAGSTFNFDLVLALPEDDS